MDVENTAGGVFQYAFRLISTLVQYEEIEVIAIIGPAGIGIFDHLIERKNFRIVMPDSVHLFPEILREAKIDLVHTPMQFHFHYTLSVPMITTLHDLQHLHYPEFFTDEEIHFRNTYYKKSAEFDERVIVSYEHVKKDLANFYKIPPEKIDVCPLGMPVPKMVDQSKFKDVITKYSLADKYLFYAANTWRHKNHTGLLRALRLVHDKYGIKISLVCTGYLYDDFYPEIHALIHELSLADSVQFIGYIPEEDLLLLLANAALVVIPTLYEAGSFPLMEAMIYEVPVICSNVTSLPDTVGDPRFIFDPNNIKEIAEKIAAMLTDVNLQNENKTNSRKLVANSDWNKVAANFVKTYAAAIEQFKGKQMQILYGTWLLNYEFFLDEEIKRLKKIFDVCESDRAARLDLICQLEAALKASETDRAARLDLIRQLEAALKTSEEDRSARLDLIHQLEAENDTKIKTIQSINDSFREKSREAEERQKEIEAIKSSLSWRIAAPLRSIYDILLRKK